jgi:hypothetical protein
MTWLHGVFQAGGPAVLLLAALTVPAIALAMVHAVAARGWSRWAAAAAIVAVVVVGLAGRWLGRRRTDRACDALPADRARYLDPDVDIDADELRARGYAEADVPAEAGAVLVAGCLVPLVIGELRRRGRPR